MSGTKPVLSMLAALLLLLLLGAFVTSSASQEPAAGEEESAESEGDEVFDDHYELRSDDDVVINFMFLNTSVGSTPQFPLGDGVQLLVVVRNDGERDVNLTRLDSSLHSAFMNALYIQNFTAREFGVPVSAESDVSLDYRFLPDPNLHPIKYQLSARLWYTVDDEECMTTFFNSTVEMVEKPFDYNFFTILSYFVNTSAAVLFVFAIVSFLRPKNSSAPASNTQKKQSGSSGAESLGWVNPNILNPSERPQRGNKSRRKSGKRH